MEGPMGVTRQRSQGLIHKDASSTLHNNHDDRPQHVGVPMPSNGQHVFSAKSARFWTISHTLIDTLIVIALLIIFGTLELAHPRAGYMVFATMFRHSYPYKDNSVPSWTVPVYSIVAPLIAFLAWKVLERRRQVTWYDCYQSFITLLFALFLTGAITNCLKVAIARPRPNFFFQCWPNGTAVYENQNQFGGYPVCSADPEHVREFRKSFPSGHSSWSAAGLGFLTFWLLGQLRACVRGEARPWAFFLSMVPALAAVVVGVTRIVDYWHNVADVCFGLALGYFISFIMYLQIFPWFVNKSCHIPRHVLLAEEATPHINREP